jgi:hypothetical protein
MVYSLLFTLVSYGVVDDRINLCDHVGNRFSDLRDLAHLELEEDEGAGCGRAHTAR